MSDQQQVRIIDEQQVQPVEHCQKSARWCYTYFVDDESWQPSEKGVKFMSWQFERTPTTQHRHCQGYVRFTIRRTMSSVQNWVKKGWKGYVRVAMGTEEENQAYTQKDETRISGPFQFGEYDPEAGKQGRRTDLKRVADMIVAEHPPLKKIAAEHPAVFIHYHKGIERLTEVLAPPVPIARDVKTLVMWGVGGHGKNHRIEYRHPDTLFKVLPGRDPFGNYDGQDVIFFDEFDWKLWPIYTMNTYLDKWRVELDCRYRNKQARWTKVYIGSQTAPHTWYNHEPQIVRDALFRRLTYVYEVTSREQEIEML